MSAEILLSSERQSWRTPAWYLEHVRRVFYIGLDPATASDNSTGARIYYDGSSGADGLALEWPGLELGEGAFINPPYGPHLGGPVRPDHKVVRGGKVIGVGTGWAAKIASYKRAPWICLVPDRHDTEWWQVLNAAADYKCCHSRRISFLDPDTGKPGKGGSTLPSVTFYRGPDPVRFFEAFWSLGDIEPCRRTIVRWLQGGVQL